MIRVCSAVLAALFLGGCATGGHLYQNNIRHVCLCAVKTVRANGYVVKEQDFQESNGTLVAAFSVPDLKGTNMIGSLTKRAGSFIWNAWEHTKLDVGTTKRVRIEERVVAKFRATGGGLFGWLDWNSKTQTTVELTADITDYGAKDWVINREDRPRDYREALLTAMSDCLAGRQVTASALPARPRLVVVEETAEPVPPQPKVEEKKPKKKQVVASAQKVEVAPIEPEKLSESEIREMLVSARGAYDSGNFAGAIATLERVARADPQNAEALGYLGASYHQLGQDAEAVRVYEEYLKLVPGDYRTRQFVEELRGK
jgi:hypothetical protein